MAQVHHFRAVLTFSLTLIVSTASYAANTVDLRFNRKWNCEGDLEVRLNDHSGHLWILVRSRHIDEKLPFYSCNSSRCDWGNNAGAEQCEVVPCAEVMAGKKEQQLWIRLKDFEGRCTMVKSIDKQD